MVRVTARAVIAAVANEHPLRDRPVRDFPCCSVRLNEAGILAAAANLPVAASRVPIPLPFQASIWLSFTACPQPFCKRPQSATFWLIPGALSCVLTLG